jgi:heptosyltransferase-2
VALAFEMPVKRGKLGLYARIKLGHSLRQHHYDQAILLPNTWKSALTPFFANIPLRTGYVGEFRWGLLNDARRLDKTKLTKTVQRFVALAYQGKVDNLIDIPKPAFQIDPKAQNQVLEKFEIIKGQKILALCPGAEYGEAKRWPVSQFAEVARQQIKQGWQVWLLGSGKDQTVTAEINQLTNNTCFDFAGKTSLSEAVALLSCVDAVVSNDSGLMHVASALSKNLVAIYGSSDPNFPPPLNDKAKILYSGLSCSPCFKRVCPLGHTDCLTGISASSVIGELNSF